MVSNYQASAIPQLARPDRKYGQIDVNTQYVFFHATVRISDIACKD